MNQFLGDNDYGSQADPLGLDAIDQQIRINELRSQVDVLGMSGDCVSPECPPEIEEQFLRNVLDFENMPLSTDFERLKSAGIELPPPETLDDKSISAKLWEVFHALAKLNTFLYATDHLSDRELYGELWNESLREESPLFPPGSGWNHHIDLVSSGSGEDTETYLRYYADEETRQLWKDEFRLDEMPPHEEPLYSRAELLPQPPPPPMWRGTDEPEGEDDGEEQ